MKDSNLRPPRSKRGALSAELMARSAWEAQMVVPAGIEPALREVKVRCLAIRPKTLFN
jgi:hypothetical protein